MTDNNNFNNNIEVIDIRIIVKKILLHKRLFYKTLGVTFVLSCLLILCAPRYYASGARLAPEVGGNTMEGALGSLASSFGFDISSMQTTDAISPLLYPDLMDDNRFVASLFDVRIKSKDGKLDTNYYTYMDKHQQTAWWNILKKWIVGLFSPKDDTSANLKNNPSPYFMSRRQNNIAEIIRRNVSISIDKKTAVISIGTKAQDPLVCKILADSVQEHLQMFITEYRTNKARIDLEYYKKLTEEAKQEYEEARQIYGSYADANMDITLESFKVKLDDLENDMQLKYNTYSTLCTQLQAAKAKVQERTPAFSVIKGAEVPIKPAGPKRMLFVISMTVLAFVLTSLYIFFRYNE